MKTAAKVVAAALCVTIIGFFSVRVADAVRSTGRPSIELVNSCLAQDNGGTLTLKSSNFTPGGNYDTEVTLNGKFYFNSWGVADSNGQTSSWRWACDSNTRPGDYGVVVFDADKQRLSNKLKFTVPKPPTADTGSTALGRTPPFLYFYSILRI